MATHQGVPPYSLMSPFAEPSRMSRGVHSGPGVRGRPKRIAYFPGETGAPPGQHHGRVLAQEHQRVHGGLQLGRRGTCLCPALSLSSMPLLSVCISLTFPYNEAGHPTLDTFLLHWSGDILQVALLHSHPLAPLCDSCWGGWLYTPSPSRFSASLLPVSYKPALSHVPGHLLTVHGYLNIRAGHSIRE